LRSVVRSRLAVLLLALASALAFVSAGGDDFPPIPPLPATSFPAPDAAEPFARALLARVPPDALARRLVANPDLIPPVLRNLGTALLSSDAALRDRLAAYHAGVARELAATPPRNDDERRRLAAIVIVDPLRYGADEAFRRRMNALLPRIVAATPAPAARAILDELTTLLPLDFDTAEAVATAAHLVPRASSARRVPFDRARLKMPDDLSPIDASFFSLGSTNFGATEAKQFVAAVHAASPKRRIVVLGNAAMRKALGDGVVFIDDHGRSFTPWPRDPFVVARASGGVTFINRPNPQPHREEDQQMVRAIVQGLPPSVDAAWKEPRWTVAPTPLHNGHILLTPTTVWISIHTVEVRALALLGLDRVPVESFAQPVGVQRYVDAVRRAAAELQTFYDSPVRFVHALPAATLSANAASAMMQRLGGGAGFDLDSIVTILPRANGKTDALVGDIGLGAAAIRQATAAEVAALRRAYGFRDDGDALRARLIDSQGAPHTVALQAFLDQVAGDLQRDGMTVHRLPLLNLPAATLARDDVDASTEFLLTWNNVVLERRGAKRRAEGFASLLPSADRFARQAFAASGYELDLFPPLIGSIVRGGGYRCASNHLR
jgi:hypothetical protein